MVIFHCYVSSPEGMWPCLFHNSAVCFSPTPSPRHGGYSVFAGVGGGTDCFTADVGYRYNHGYIYIYITIYTWDIYIYMEYIICGIYNLYNPNIRFLSLKWVCLKIGYIPNYSHLIGIMIINHWV